jgi:hypothetical protein
MNLEKLLELLYVLLAFWLQFLLAPIEACNTHLAGGGAAAAPTAQAEASKAHR